MAEGNRMSNVALYEMAGAYRQLMETLSEGDFDATTIADTVEASGIVDDIAQKAAGIEMVARSLEVHVPAVDAEIERLTALKKRRQNAAKGLRDYLRANMQAMGITKLESPLFVIKLQNNPAAVDVFEPGLIPAEFMTQPAPPPPAPDKKAIAGALKAGIDIPGARLVQGQRLAIS
jgi:hypothetical protein